MKTLIRSVDIKYKEYLLFKITKYTLLYKKESRVSYNENILSSKILVTIINTF